MRHKYYDSNSCIQVLGSIYLNPKIFDEPKYVFTKEDFPDELHMIIFGAMSNLYSLGASEININTIEDYLENHTKKYAVYQNEKGKDFLQEVSQFAQLAAFDYYYNRMKKMTLMRCYNEWAGMDLSWLYDPDNLLDSKKKERQEQWFDNTSVEDIADLINDKITKVRTKMVQENSNGMYEAGEGIFSMLRQLEDFPEIGIPLYGDLFNTVFQGARLGKFYLRSAATGVGKSRSMIADVCTIGISEYYDPVLKEWIQNKAPQPVLYITTEQELEEIQTMMLAFVAGVNESHILHNDYLAGEYNRVQQAAKLIKISKVLIKELPDFSLTDIENSIKLGVYKNNARYVFFDYIHSSMKILGEVAGRAKVQGLREDNVLFMISVRLKDLCNELGVFIMSATQLSNDYHYTKDFDQSLLQGAKAIANKIDCGMIMIYVTDEDKEALKTLIENNGFEIPAIKISVYKNRRGEHNRLFLWATEDRGTCRITPQFATDYQYNLVDLPKFKIHVQPANIQKQEE